MSKKAELSPKHYKAIELIDEGKMSIKEIAAAVGLSTSMLYKLYEGADDAGGTGQLFKAAVHKNSQKQVNKIKELARDSKLLALRMINNFLRRKNSLDYQDDKDVELITTVFNSLCKSAPNIEINNTSYSYVKGLSAEELLHEYNKLRSLTEGSSIRTGVPGPGSGSPRVLLELNEPGSGNDPEPKDPDL